MPNRGRVARYHKTTWKDNGSSGISLNFQVEILHFPFLPSSVVRLLKHHHPSLLISSAALEHRTVTQVGAVASDGAELQRGGAVVGSCGVGGMYMVFVPSAAEVFLAGHSGCPSCAEFGNEVWLLKWVVNGTYVVSNTHENAIVKIIRD